MPDLEKLLNAIDAAEETSYGSEYNSDLERDRALAIDYYNGRNIEPAPEGRSQVVSRDVFETVQWVLPSLCRIFASGDSVVEFVPMEEADEQAAEQESDYLNYLVTQKNDWFQTFLQWAQDALITKNSYCLAYMEETLRTEEESYKGQSDESLALIMEGDGVEIVNLETYDSGEVEPVVDETGQMLIDELGQPMLQPKMLHNVTIKRVKPQKRLAFRVLPPERIRVSEHTPDFTLDHCDYFEYWEFVTISSLRAMGFEVPDDIASDEEVDTDEDDARDIYYENERGSDVGNAIDPAMRRVKCRTVWIRYDYDEDGISELQKVYIVGRRFLGYSENQEVARETVSRIPVACIVPTIATHRHIGFSIADQVADLQRIKTAVLRQALDSLYISNNPRYGASNRVNLDDLMVAQPGGIVQIDSDAPDAAGHLFPLQTEFVFPQAMAAMEYIDQIRENRTGTNRYFTGVDQNALNKTATGIQQLSTMAAQRVEQIARIFATGVEHLFSLAHELVLKHGHQAETVKLRGQWVTVDPSTWKTGRDLRIVVGYGAGNKDALVARLMMILNAQKEAMMGGLRVVDEKNVYEALIELTKASDFSAPERFWTDPAKLPPPQPQPSEAEVYAQTEQAKLQSSEKEKLAELSQKEQESQRRTQLEEYKANLDAEVKIVLEQLRQGGSADLESMRAQLRNAPIEVENEKLEQANQLIQAIAESQAGQTEQFGQMLSSLGERLESVIQSMNAPREVMRDKSGRVIGVRSNGVERAVQRDGQGRVVGLQ